MKSTSFIFELYALCTLGTAGDYWDFKAKWHGSKVYLLHDIICMANSLKKFV
jgi:hypothetical protein